MDIFAAIAARRRELADHLDGLDETGWGAPSLCTGWTVRTVVGHLVSPILENRLAVAREAVKALGRFHVVMERTARRHALRPTAELVRLLREGDPARGFVPPVAGPPALLYDNCVHTCDIRWPAGEDPQFPPEVLRTVLDFMVSGNPVLRIAVPSRFKGVRFEATDLDWSFGTGPAVRGPATALMMARSGRPAAFERLEGAGVAVLRAG